MRSSIYEHFINSKVQGVWQEDRKTAAMASRMGVAVMAVLLALAASVRAQSEDWPCHGVPLPQLKQASWLNC